MKLPAQAQYIIALSTLQPRKNLPVILKAFHRVAEASNAHDLYLVCAGAQGWGNQESYFEALPASVRNRIIATGYVDDEVLSALLSDALCLVYPSLYEGFGLPPLEAMRLGVPVIVSNRGSLPEVIGPGGKIVDVSDDVTIAETILRWSSDKSERAKWAKRARERAEEFSWDASASKIIETMVSQTKLRHPNDMSMPSRMSRNQSCPCGSSKKYKHCHGALTWLLPLDLPLKYFFSAELESGPQ